MIKKIIKRIQARFLLLIGNGKMRLTHDEIHFLVRKRHYQLRKSLIYGWEAVFEELTDLADENTIFLDVGANIGIASLLLTKKRSIKAYAFEPNLATYCELCENILLNPDLDITPFNLAISNHAGFVPMTNIPSSGINRVININTSKGRKTILKEGLIHAPATTLDRFLQDYLTSIHPQKILIKIDVERYEISVLMGSTELLQKQVPIAVCSEFYSSENLLEIEKFLCDFGFQRWKSIPNEDGINAFFVNQYWPCINK